MVDRVAPPYVAAVQIKTRNRIRWRVCLTTSADAAYRMLTTDDGRRAFWADSADEVEPGVIEFKFRSGETWRSRILERRPPTRFRLSYFNGSDLTFDLDQDTARRTVVTVTEIGLPYDDWLDNYAGWVSVLMNFKAAIEFGIDLRNDVPDRSWRMGFVDV